MSATVIDHPALPAWCQRDEYADERLPQAVKAAVRLRKRIDRTVSAGPGAVLRLL